MTALALLGGRPAFASEIRVGRPNVGDRTALIARLGLMLDSGVLTNRGPFVLELEAALRSYLGVRHAITVCNATLGLGVAARALGLAGEVIVPSFTYIATPQALAWLGITPVFCDVDPDTHNLDPRQLEALITPRTTGILPVHVWGRPCDTQAIERVACAHGLKTLYDAAHAFGCSHDGQMIGSFGHAEVFSFHATKFFNTFEGGAIATNDDNLAAKIIAMTNFGQLEEGGVHVGTNAKMTEVCAAMGLASFERIDAFAEINRARHETYRRELAGLPGLRLVEYDARERCNFQYAILEIDPARAGLSRDTLQAVLAAENVIARKYFYPACHQAEVFRTSMTARETQLPHAEALAVCCLSLPTGAGASVGDVEVICDVIRRAFALAPMLPSGRRW